MKFGFVTCVELGMSCIAEIHRLGGRLDLVITLQDHIAPKKSGRVFVDDYCANHQIPLVKIRHINDADSIQTIKDHDIDWLFIIGWSQIASKAVLAAPKRGVLGIHPTLLPVGRGRASIPWAIIKGVSETGVTLFQLDEGVDTGPILAQDRLPLAEDETSATLYPRVAEAHRKLIGRVWPDLMADRLKPDPQDHSKATEWPGRTPADGRIMPNMTTSAVDRLVRASTKPYPGAFWDDATRRLRVWSGRALTDPNDAQGVVIQLHDGWFDAIEYEWEPFVQG